MHHVESRQIRAARGLLKWSQGQLAEAAGRSVLTVKRIENEDVGAGQASTEAVVAALEAAGVRFLPAGAAGKDSGCGVVLREGASRT